MVVPVYVLVGNEEFFARRYVTGGTEGEGIGALERAQGAVGFGGVTRVVAELRESITCLGVMETVYDFVVREAFSVGGLAAG